MPRTKNVSAPGGGDDEDPRRPFRQVKGKTVYLEQQEGRKKRRMDRAARAAAAAAAPTEQAELGDQPQTPSDQIAYRVRRLASRPRSSSTTTASASTPPPTLPAPVTPVAPSTTSTTPASESSLLGYGGLDDNPIKGLTSVLSVEQVLNAKLTGFNTSEQV
jgi:hypothetical protein